MPSPTLDAPTVAEEKKRALQGLVGLFSAELIGLGKRRSVLADFQANRRSKCRFVRWHFLFGRNRKGNQNQPKKDTPDLHTSLEIRFWLPPAPPTLITKPFGLVHKTRKSCPQDSSHLCLLNNHHDPEIVSIPGIEIYLHIVGKRSGFIHYADADEVSQNCHMVKRPSRILSATHLRLVSVVCESQEDDRGLHGHGGR